MTALAEGDKLRAFRLASDGGGSVSLASLKGRPFVLYFYPKDDTTGCTKEAIDFSNKHKEFRKLGVDLIGVSKDSVTSHDRFKSKYGLKFTLASDPETKLADAFGVWVEKSMYGRKYMGIERSTFLVDSKGVVRHVWRKVKVPGHVEEVLSAARSL